MLSNFIFAEKSLFEQKLNNGEVLDEAIAFIEDTKEIWTHGTYFDGSKVDLSNIENSIQNILDTKQDNLVSGTNIKTINGESILGSGDIVISGGGDYLPSNRGGAYSEVNHGTSDTTFALTPNTFHVWDEVTNLTLTFGSETSGVANEYLFQFTSGATATTLTLPDDIKWVNDSAPTIVENRIYQVSVLKGLASCLEFNNTTSTLITFIVGDTYYNAELNMNWLDWTISKYNVDSFVSDSIGIFVPSRETYVNRPDETGLVSQSDIIIPNAQYFYMD